MGLSLKKPVRRCSGGGCLHDTDERLGFQWTIRYVCHVDDQGQRRVRKDYLRAGQECASLILAALNSGNGKLSGMVMREANRIHVLTAMRGEFEK